VGNCASPSIRGLPPVGGSSYPRSGVLLTMPPVRFSSQRDIVVLERQRGGWRVFKSIDAAVNTAHGIGFRRIEIDLSSR